MWGVGTGESPGGRAGEKSRWPSLATEQQHLIQHLGVGEPAGCLAPNLYHLLPQHPSQEGSLLRSLHRWGDGGSGTSLPCPPSHRQVVAGQEFKAHPEAGPFSETLSLPTPGAGPGKHESWVRRPPCLGAQSRGQGAPSRPHSHPRTGPPCSPSQASGPARSPPGDLGATTSWCLLQKSSERWHRPLPCAGHGCALTTGRPSASS